MRSQSYRVESHMAHTQVCRAVEAGRSQAAPSRTHALMWDHQNSDRRDPIPPHPSTGRSVFAKERHLSSWWTLAIRARLLHFQVSPHLKLEAGWCLNLRGSHWGYHFSFLTAGVYIAHVHTREALSKPWVDWLLGQLNPCLPGIVTDTKVREFFFPKALSDKFRIWVFISYYSVYS